MGRVIRGPWRHARASSSFRAASNANASSEIPRWPLDCAKDTSDAQCGAGMPRVLQPLTVDMDCSSPSATAAVPPNPEMISSQDFMTPNIVRVVRTSQGFAQCETTFSTKYVPIFPMEPDSDQAVGRRIIALRTRAKLQQQELAKQINVAKSTLAGYESGERPLTMESARRLRKRFGVTLDWLLFGDMQAAAQALMLEIGPAPAPEELKKVRTLRQ